MILRGAFYSETLEMETSVAFALPDRKRGAAPRAVVYLLHGLKGRAGDWLDYSMLPSYAGRYDALFVMPEAGRSFYCDMEYGQRFFSYVADELPSAVGEAFAVSAGREDTLVVGASMGGYGALKLALSRPERYGACAAFSSPCLFLQEGLAYQREREASGEFRAAYGDRLINDFHAIFGPALEWRERDDVLALARKAASAPARPRVYLACGTADPFLADNRRFAAELARLGLEAEYEERPGSHEFRFFDAALERALERLLGERSASGGP